MPALSICWPDANATTALRRATVRATLAPSVHNTQPWRFVIRPGGVEIHADYARQLRVLDPSRRQLTISVGCALFNLRVALAGAGYDALVGRLPDPTMPTLIASVRVADARPAREIAALDAVLELRQTNRRRFADEVVPAELVDRLVEVAEAEGGVLYPVRSLEQRIMVASLSQHADQEQNSDPAYRAELRAWTTDDPIRRDGVPAMAVPHVDGTAQDEVPIRDFDTHGNGFLPAHTQSSTNQTLLLLGADGDAATDWLRTGEALERVLLEITRHGYVASPLTQVVEVPHTRAVLRQQLGLQMYPDVLLRVGRAAVTPSSRRRQLADVITELPE
jgi:hypothetical protein